MAAKNKIYVGDNLDVMKRMPDRSVDLIYLDPPFNSGKNYNLAVKGKDGKATGAFIEAFTDTWEWNAHTAEAYQELLLSKRVPENVKKRMELLYGDLGGCPLLAYLVMMAPRLVEMRRVLKDTGSIYLHCDPSASHYLKMLMDAIFGMENFRNDISWCYTGPSNTRGFFPRKHDILLFYCRDRARAVFYPEAVRVPYKSESFTMGGSGSLAAKNRKGNYTTGREEYLAKGKVVEDYWTDIPSLSVSKERLGYPTQKPEALLERIIKASCPPKGIVFDPFCGCGTTVSVAERLGLEWIGADINAMAIAVIQRRLEDTFGASLRPYEIPADAGVDT